MMLLPQKFGFSKRGIPFFSIFGNELHPHYYLFLALTMRQWTIQEGTDSMEVSDGKVELFLRREHALSMVFEWHRWRWQYLPTFTLKGKTVMDVGAGSGESAYFFLKNGASKVIAVENGSYGNDVLPLLERNVKSNNWPVEIVPISFSLNMLQEFDFDWMKMDIEGGERILLECESLPPCAIEVHSNQVALSLINKFRLKLVSHNNSKDFALSILKTP